ncbi:NAD(P)/FAD-dependent oxidoreductase [Nocardia sp. 2YAB30]|uniref:NAD(P)/FAD-dependent oxidoreductase n=1 Tax=Nocardia sp. 2YAB30 TaxID=3233022 RepID=UPI003F98C70E
MADRYDFIVVGGGVAGLMTAARLSEQDTAVALIEGNLLGSGATTRNHGIVHSGALYARWHPEVMASCMQAQGAYGASFPKCISDIEMCWYMGKPETMRQYGTLWDKYGIDHGEVNTWQVRELLTVPDSIALQTTATRELLVDTHSLITDLAARCLANGVDLIVGTRVSRIVVADHVVRGVETATGLVQAANVMVCNGIGTLDVLERSKSMIAEELRSRLEIMMAFPGELPCSIIGLEFGWPALAPSAAGGVVLASRYGARQRFVRGPARWPVPATETTELTRELTEWLRPGLVDCTSGVAWVCSKTEHARGTGDQWGTEPNYAVINHYDREGITGLWTVLPGKMTLALHASRVVVAAVTGTEQPLALPTEHGGRPSDVFDLVDAAPWTAHQEVSPR